MTDRFICLHGHFYQPPRENPWLESIELQDSAYPYHDWNERITAECYAPNMASRILDGSGHIVQIVNNYSKISFNFGPTLLSWMETKSPEVYQSILVADQESLKNFSGHGSAMAQGFNHMVLPLANLRDKHTQVIWGLEDFRSRFKRDPEGMWLPETAVNTETLEVLAEHGLKFTVLSPVQAARSRKIGAKAWKDTTDGSIDPSHPYLINLPSGRSIAVYFYDSPIARSVAFEKLLSNGENFSNRLLNAYSSHRSWTQLVNIATDGETFGHHHRHGEMAISYAIHHLEANQLARITNYGEFLEKFPPTHEAEIIENTSWSCFHGIERWKSNCGCHAGAPAGWNQEWRTPLRSALDWLRDTLSPKFEEHGKQIFKDPWGARNDYIHVCLNRTTESTDAFFDRNAIKPLTKEEKIRGLKLLEMQRHAQLMYTSCGWFFNDITNIETVQILQYAGRALQLSQEVFGEPIQEEFLTRLAQAQSNIVEVGNGRKVFERFVLPSMVTLEKVGAHYALTSLFQTYEDMSQIYCYTVDCDNYQLIPEGKARLALGRAHITSNITGESKRVVFTALSLGDHNLTGATQEFKDEPTYLNLVESLTNSFELGDLPGFFRVVDQNFKGSAYTLKALFKDEQRSILRLVLDSTLKEAEAAYRQIYEHHASLMRFLAELNMPLPKPFYTAAEYALSTSFREALESEEPDLGKITILLEEAKRSRVALDEEGLSFTLEKTINRIAGQLLDNPDELSLLQLLEVIVDLAITPPLRTNFWKTQNIYHELFLSHLPRYQARAEQNEEFALQWVKHFLSLGEKLKIKK